MNIPHPDTIVIVTLRNGWVCPPRPASHWRWKPFKGLGQCPGDIAAWEAA